jgi:hypothetical protein
MAQTIRNAQSPRVSKFYGCDVLGKKARARAERHRRAWNLAYRCARHSRAVTAEDVLAALLGTEHLAVEQVAA